MPPFKTLGSLQGGSKNIVVDGETGEFYEAVFHKIEPENLPTEIIKNIAKYVFDKIVDEKEKK